MKTPWSHTPNANPFVTEYRSLNATNGALPNRIVTLGSGVQRPSALQIIALNEDLLALPLHERSKMLNSLSGSTVYPTPVKSRSIADPSNPFTEQLWATTSGEYGVLVPVTPLTTEHRLSTAKWYIADHPFWTNQRLSSAPPYQGLATTYMDLGKSA